MTWKQIRLTQIENHLLRDLELLGEYEKAIRLTDDPKQRIKYQGEIDRLKSMIALAESEKQALLAPSPPPPDTEGSSPELARVVLTREGREMVLVAPGEFLYGAEQTVIDLPAYYIDRYPVTNGEYQHFLRSMDYPAPGHWPDGALPQGKEKHPVVNVTYSEAASYAHWAGKRLPTEQEWEKGARGTDGRLWPWGHRFDEQLINNMWRLPFEQRSTTMVGSFSPQGDSPFGVGDVGHLWEWTSSWFEPSRYKVVRGGPWRNTQKPPLVINRSFEDDRAHDVGFRCACDAHGINNILATILDR